MFQLLETGSKNMAKFYFVLFILFSFLLFYFNFHYLSPFVTQAGFEPFTCLTVATPQRTPFQTQF